MRVVGVVVGIPEPWGSQLSALRAAVGDPAAQAVPPHVTLLPPTEVPDDGLDLVEKHLAEVAAANEPFELHLRGSGTFRPVSDVVFVAVASGISECEVIQGQLRVDPVARELTFPYHPHVTVAHDVAPELLDRAYDALAAFEARFTVEGFTLFQHGPAGRWRPHREYTLGERAAALRTQSPGG